ncbi:MAG: hypothetical protein MJK08_13860 [Campylobacterales bacterium]|nr:hypothetical protein [Campylobacterales bacterium]
MKSILKLIAITSILLVVLTGCRSAVVYNVENSPVMIDKDLSQKEMFKSIYAAGTTLGWQIKKVKPGLAVARLQLRSHVANIEIPFNAKEFSIIYKNSINLRYDKIKGTIHSNYNGWIQNLEKAINIQITLQGM